MPIYGISDFKRLPRLGKIKLGKKDESRKGAPVQTRYFVCPEEIQKIYGPEPTELDIMFPLNDTEIVFPQYMKLYGKTGLKCKGDGRNAMAMVGGVLKEKTCTPGAKECQGCKPIGTLNVLLPKVPGFGVWQIWTSSWNSIVNLNSSIDMIRAMTGGRIAFIKLKLELQEHNATVTKDDGKQFQKKVYVMNLNIDQTMGQFYQQHSLEANRQRSLENPGYKALADTNNVLAGMVKKQHKNSQDDAVIDVDGENWELDDDDEDEGVIDIEPSESAILRCSSCGKLISDAEKEYSQKHFKRVLCMDCQTEIRKQNKIKAQ
jgi:hypothetical protein